MVGIKKLSNDNNDNKFKTLTIIINNNVHFIAFLYFITSNSFFKPMGVHL